MKKLLSVLLCTAFVVVVFGCCAAFGENTKITTGAAPFQFYSELEGMLYNGMPALKADNATSEAGEDPDSQKAKKI